MKTAAFIAVALSGLALAAPGFKRTGVEWKDLTTLKYANSMPISIVKGEEHSEDKRAASAIPVKDNRNLQYANNLPIAKKPASA
ncbi:hypothetical protein Trco_007877 [Trichoderma cornu-damae]|uniref:Uncharacterized protein n=1 Tax=Trichoderma cornu-damae TaxID=654480 RepID=A0A9P8TRQ3_9HYPO|nr:hypothetical protein Trco_007877 [Trichoderma cornu-damae]